MTTLHQIFHLLDARERRRFAWLSVLILLTGLLEVAGVVSVLPFIQLVADPGVLDRYPLLRTTADGLGLTSQRDLLLATGAAVVGLLLLTNAFSVLRQWLQLRYSWQGAHRVSIRLLWAYLGRPYEYYLRRHTSTFTSYIIGETNQFTSGVIIPLIEVVSRLFVCLVLFLLLIWVDPLIAVTMFSVLGLSYGIIYLLQRGYLRRVGEERLQLSVRRYRALAELFDGIKTVQVFGRQSFFASHYEAASEEFCELQPRFQLAMLYPRYLLEVLAFGSIVAVTIFLYLRHGDVATVVPQLSLYAVAGYRLLPALQAAFAALAKYVHNRPLVAKLYEAHYDQGPPTTVVAPDTQAGPALSFDRALRLDRVSFTYAGAEEPTLHRLSVTVPRGETVAFVGPTGSGKTTTVDLLVGLLEPTAGRILLDDQPLRPDQRAAWRSAVAYVPQEVFLFDDTVSRNIVLGDVDTPVDRQRLEDAARLADIHDFIVGELPQGYATTIGEKGVRLSGGQRQRLGLARAFYHQPAILVLDEATSALDNVTERGIVASLDALPEQMTVVLIAHRLSTVRHADRIFVLEDGRLTASGSYDELLSSSPTFRQMATAPH